MLQLAVKRLFLWGTILPVLIFLGAACGGGGETTGESTPTATAVKPLSLADNGWETLRVSNAIVKFVIENGLDAPVPIVPITDQQQFQDIWYAGDIQMMVELWHENYRIWYNPVVSRGDMSPRGVLYEGGIQAWYVPTYVIEGDAERGIEATAPDLVSVDDLAQYGEALGNAFVSCPAGFNCANINGIKLDSYGLTDVFTIEYPDTYDALAARLKAAYEAGEPVLGYYREPTWLMRNQDWTRIEEPESTQLCWARTLNVQASLVRPYAQLSRDERTQTIKGGACAYPEADVEAAIRKPYYVQHYGASELVVSPEKNVANILWNLHLGTEEFMNAIDYMHENDVTPDEAAIYYLKNNDAKWRGWFDVEPALPESIAKVSQALAAR